MGEGFGEGAIITGLPYTTNVVATGECTSLLSSLLPLSFTVLSFLIIFYTISYPISRLDPLLSSVITEDTTVVAFTEKSLRLVLRDDEAKLAEMKLRIKGSDLELASILNFPPACALFEEFMRVEHAPENLYFWKSLERFEDICLRLQRLVERLRTGDATGTEIRKGTGTGAGREAGTVCGRGAGASSSTGLDSPYPWRLKTTATAATATSGTIRYPTESFGVEEESSSRMNQIQATTRTTSRSASISTLAQTITRTLALTPTVPPAQAQGKHPTAPHLALGAGSRKVLDVGFAQLRDVVQDMMDQYVLEGSPNQVNLPGKMRVQLEKDVFSWLGTVRHLGLGTRETEWENGKEGKEGDNGLIEGRRMSIGSTQKELVIPKEMFAKAKTECYMIMRKDTYARWRITDQFSDFFDNLKPLASARISVLTDCCHAEGEGEGEGTGSAGTKAVTTCFSSPAVMRQHSLLPGSGPGSVYMLSSQLTLKLQQSVDQTESGMGTGTGIGSEIRTILPFVGAVNQTHTPYE